MPYPRMIKIRQKLDDTRLADIPSAVKAELRRVGLASRIRPGATVAITAGSRGISGKPAVLATIVGEVKALGAVPFLFPAMGSHGGGDAEAQKEILRDYGITEEAMGAPVRASMEVARIGETESGIPVQIDRHAAEADHIIVVNRGQAPHGVQRRDRERPHQDDGHRHGKAPGRDHGPRVRREERV